MKPTIFKQIAIVIVLSFVLILAWWGVSQSRQAHTAAFIHAECQQTAAMLLDTPETNVLALRLEFLQGYYQAHAETLAGSPLADMMRTEYQETVSNVQIRLLIK